MPFETIQLGSAPAGAGGDDNRTAFTRINANFAGIKSRGLDEYMAADIQSGSVLAGYPTGCYYFASTCTDLPVAGVGIYAKYVKRYFSSSPSEYYVEVSTNHASGPRKFINRTSGGVWTGWQEVFTSGDWKTITLLNGWTNWGSGWPVAQYKTTPLGIFLRGLIRPPSSGGTANLDVFSIPGISVTNFLLCAGDSAHYAFSLGAGGSMRPYYAVPSTTWISLSGLWVPGT